jgi:dihydroorotate dehydrogenase electron transfer subunit
MTGPQTATSAAGAPPEYREWSMHSHAGAEALSRPRAVPIVAFEALSERHFAFAVRDPALARCKPGQFCMQWIPGVDEVPMGISETDPDADTAWFLVDRVGDATRALGALGVGDRIGVRGPYGRPFDVPADAHLLLVGGGTGTAPLLKTVQAATERGSTCDVVIGARDDILLVWEERFRRAAERTFPCTDDGSHGFHGFTTQQAEALIEGGNTYDAILTCGPERMMAAMVDIAARHDIPCQVSLERYMKCGIGVCGSCVLGEGIRACVEGPCFPHTELPALPDFGVFHRGPDGTKHPW